MFVFLSWSGPRSRGVADALYLWLPQVVQTVDPWVSTHSIDKGDRGADVIAGALGEARVGIVCLTPNNRVAPWILYEAGALSKTRDRVWTLLLDGLKPGDVQPPLGQFQHTVYSKAEMRELVASINRFAGVLGERVVEDRRLDSVFEALWPKFEELMVALPTEESTAPQRPEREILDELLGHARQQEERQFDVSNGGMRDNVAIEIPLAREEVVQALKAQRFFGPQFRVFEMDLERTLVIVPDFRLAERIGRMFTAPPNPLKLHLGRVTILRP